jgi:hypothetical protein
MRTLSTPAATALFLLAAAPGLADCDRVSVGTITREPEKDTVGFLCVPERVTQTGSVGWAPGKIVQVGVRTGDAERDTFGYVVLNLGE